MTRRLEPHASVAPLLRLLGCAHSPGAADAVRGPLPGLDERAGLVLADDPWGDGATNLVYLSQGWRAPETLW